MPATIHLLDFCKSRFPSSFIRDTVVVYDSSHIDPVDPAVLDRDRLDALRETALLDSPPEESFDRLTELVRRVLGVPVSLISLVDADRQFFKSQCGLAEPWASRRETPLTHSFCKHVVATGEPLVVECATLHPLVRRNLAIRDLGVVSYVGVPLTTPDGHVLGSLCAIDSTTREWSEEDVVVLRSIAGPVMNEIALRAQAKEIREYATRLVETNEMLGRYASELQVANAAKERFFSIVAHDLRSPLQTILGYSSALVEECSCEPDSDLSHFATRLETAAFGMGRFLENLLQWALVQNGKVKCEPAPFNVDELLQGAVDLVFEQAERKEIQLLPIVESQLMVHADAALVTSIVHNLLTNAIKFTPRGGEVRVQVDQAGPEVRITVEDNGIGIPEEILTELFEINHKASRPGTEKETGSGLGLIMCRDLVRLNSGQIWADSRPGVGTKMHFTLPSSGNHEAIGRQNQIKDRESTPGAIATVGRVQKAGDTTV